ncbi:MAG TPA: lytic transglycosylase domain-containing protein [Allosphingosinicella sp.]|jgi:soluble lytic murein transglycosylase-like protein
MGSVRLAILATVAFAVSTPAVAAPVDRWSGHIAEASSRFAVPEAWIRRVMQAESGGRTHLGGRPIVSRTGAMGLMQLMPGTWREVRTLLRLGADPHDPRDNILAGTYYLRAMYDRFGYPGLFAAYNAGPGRYSRHLATGRPLPGETVAYVAAVSGKVPAAPAVTVQARGLGAEPAPPLFALRASVPQAMSAEGEVRPSGPSISLFVPLSAGVPR